MSGETTVVFERRDGGATTSGRRRAQRVCVWRMAGAALFAMLAACPAPSTTRGAMQLWFDSPAADVQTLGLWVQVHDQVNGRVDLSSLDALLCPLDINFPPRNDGGGPVCAPSLQLKVTSARQLDGVLVVPFTGRTRPLVAARLFASNGSVVQSAFVRPPVSVQPASLDAGADADAADAQDATDARDITEVSEVVSVPDADARADIVSMPDAEGGADASDASMDATASDTGDSGAGGQ
jgi:hypothetical protein